ncbi:MAG TPA: prepilin-type N-terminal cleavage/methylation domain-containing protein [Myxococcales bacterium LLY-WYZ-16_1]|jgi:general secretion pathway protein I|nr:prepilin-type N-terminal cleavage/methylation domain-containing protein [Myxococcales bacterium LLY-WYZ-16_1]
MMRRGFSLLEIMVAMSILALSLTVIAGINANSFDSSNYARGLTVATLLARSKMLDIELELQDDGFSQGERDMDGDFSDEGYDEVEWEAVVRPIDVDVSKLVRQFFGGELNAENLPDQMQAFMGASRGIDPSELEDEAVPADRVREMLGGNQLELVFRQVSETLEDAIREIVLDVRWGPEGDRESIRFVQYITTTGRIAAPSGRTGNRSPSTVVPQNVPGQGQNPAAQPVPSPFGN